MLLSKISGVSSLLLKEFHSVLRSTLILCLCFLLTACGFRPLHVPIEGTTCVAVPVKISTIKDRDGQILRNYLVDLLTPSGAPQNPQYILDITITDVFADIGVNKDETVRRKKVTITANISLRDAKTNKVVYTHSALAINSFNILSQDYFSDLVAEEYAKKEALRLLAEKITLLLTTFIANKNES